MIYVDALAEVVERVGLGELFETLLKVRLAESHLDAVGFGGDGGVVVAVMTLHTFSIHPRSLNATASAAPAADSEPKTFPTCLPA